MTTTAIQRYSEKFPEEISKAIDGLGGDTERAVVIVLFNQGDLAFTELREELGDDEPLHPETLSNALSNLKSGGLIRKRALENGEEDPFSSYYTLSEYGERFIYSLFDSLGSLQGPAGRRQAGVSAPLLEDSLLESGEDLARNLQKQLVQR
ncbi:hypothetical protein [Halorubrum sp. BV1]|uniref:hypothetical protein n=1 Tax=Halorubrum sp. BV1 TaxID=1498500 RepID=UPI0012BAA991|nr:hypothetical protein [Halorubrum sp. BV1]